MENQIHFYSSYIPKVTPGKYTAKTSQNINYGAGEETFHSKDLEFYVEGPKFELEPGMIHHCYPSSGVEGEYVADMPSIVLNRITLPWERTKPGSTNPNDSWLMLFMVDEEEEKKLTEITGEGQTLFSNVSDRYLKANATVLKIPDELLSLFPKDEEHQYLSYCREEIVPDDQEATHAKKSVLLCHRLPKPGSKNTVYLVSLEHCMEEDGYKTYPYLHKWSFISTDTANYLIPQGSTWAIEGSTAIPEDLTGILYNNTSEFEAAIKSKKATVSKKVLKALKERFSFNGGTFHGLLHQLPGKLERFKYPTSSGSTHTQIKQGAVILKDKEAHTWYRGPLQAHPVSSLLRNTENQIETKWTGAKKYLSAAEYKAQGSLSDSSYLVAHELGSLTALKDEDFHKAFFEWKQELNSAILSEASQASTRAVGHVTYKKLDSNKAIPTAVKEKIDAWKRLKGIPYAYLIPSSKMLPHESIRTFCIDVNWINAFILGALSIGNTSDTVEQKLLKRYGDEELFLETNTFGFLINSLAVGGWPEFNVIPEFYGGNQFDPQERKKLAKNIELFIYEGNSSNGGELETLTLQLPTGKTHSGFRLEGGKFKKQYYDSREEINLDVKVSNLRLINILDLVGKAPKLVPLPILVK